MLNFGNNTGINGSVMYADFNHTESRGRDSENKKRRSHFCAEKLLIL